MRYRQGGVPALINLVQLIAKSLAKRPKARLEQVAFTQGALDGLSRKTSVLQQEQHHASVERVHCHPDSSTAVPTIGNKNSCCPEYRPTRHKCMISRNAHLHNRQEFVQNQYNAGDTWSPWTQKDSETTQG